MSLSLGRLVSFAVAVWLSIQLSRLLRFFLDEEVYERIHLSPGLPYAISTILNYLVLLVGFLIALGLLGVDLTKITIVAGAFSVGLGFGLQNIINNFVSGIILLFERPVKVGDVIQIGDAVGEVRRIGIRASIVRTRDGSDVILPNGNLISNQVTNWTYADRCRAVEIPFNIAAGPDPTHVLELLKTAATTSPATDDRPAPTVYITAIGAGGVERGGPRVDDAIRGLDTGSQRSVRRADGGVDAREHQAGVRKVVENVPRPYGKRTLPPACHSAKPSPCSPLPGS